MELNPSEWIHLALRWIHVFAGILWIGSTWYFTWLDGRFHDPAENPGGQVWMVHSGGFYVVEKRKRPELASRKLHWFRWEAAITWLSGMLLLGIVYHLGGALVEDASKLWTATALGLGLLVVGWIVYDLLWISPLGQNELVGGALSYALLVGAIFGLSKLDLLSKRAVYMHVGALLGTLMAANVWLRILPAQRELIAASAAGKEPDQRLADRAKGRSKHNNFMVMPLIFIMLSNHFYSTFSSDWSWLILSGLTLAGFGAAKVLRER